MTEANVKKAELDAKDKAVLNGSEFDIQLRKLCPFYNELSYDQKTTLIEILSSNDLADFYNTMYEMRPSSPSTPKAEPSEGDKWVLEHN